MTRHASPAGMTLVGDSGYKGPGRDITLHLGHWLSHDGPDFTTSTDTALRIFLSSLDQAPLSVQQTGEEAESYTFVWASGYDNGATVRIQGRLQGG